MAGPNGGRPSPDRAVPDRATPNAASSVPPTPSSATRPPYTGDTSRVGGAPASGGDASSAAAGPSEPPAPGRRFGRYEIVRELGRGAMGEVYLARDTRLDRPVALKIPRLDGPGGDRLLARLEREAKVLARLDHPHICKVYDFDAVGDTRFIAMEYVEGEDLQALMRRHGRKRKPAEAVKVAIQLARAVGAAHARGVLHRDLKPANVMRRADGRLVVMDFGLARQEEVVGAARTLDGETMGTPAYMSPEQASGPADAIDVRSDVYALGVMLFEMLTGEWPFTGHYLEIMGRKATQPPPSPAELNPRLPAGLCDVCLKMMAREKEDRYPDCEAVVAVLASVDLTAASAEGVTTAGSAEASIAAAVPTGTAAGGANPNPFAMLRDLDLKSVTEKNPPARRRADRPAAAKSLAGPTPVPRRKRAEAAPKNRLRRLAAAAGGWWSGRPPRMRRGLAGAAGAGGLAAVAMFLLAPLGVFRIEIGEATLRIEGLDPDMRVSVTDGGKTVEIVDLKTGAVAELDPGTYELTLNSGGREGFTAKLSKEVVTLSRGDKAVVTVSKAAKKTAGLPTGPGPFRWLSYSVHDPDAVRDVAGDVNLIHDRSWPESGDSLIREARRLGVPVVLGLFRGDFPAAEAKLFELVRLNRDVVAGVCLVAPYQAASGLSPDQVGAFGRRLKASFPGISYWVSYIEMPHGMSEPLPPVPEEVDVVDVAFYFHTSPQSLRRSVGLHMQAWRGRADGRPVVLRWVSRPTHDWNAGRGPLKTADGTMTACFEVAEEYKLAGIVFDQYGRRPDDWSPGIDTDPRAVREIQAWGLRYGISREREAKRSPITTVAGETRDDNGLGLTLVWCPPGAFIMGSPANEEGREPGKAEDPVRVTLTAGFWLGRTEVTQAQWRGVMETEPWKGQESVVASPDHPAVYVDWDDATAFCRQLTERERSAGRLPADWEYILPTDAQWEYACRAGTTTRFHFGDDQAGLGEYDWYSGNASDLGEKYGHAVGVKTPNGWGLCDLHGNVWEWCRDWYNPRLPGGRDPLVGTSEWTVRSNRGGGWSDAAAACRSAARSGTKPYGRSGKLGFRVALVPGGRATMPVGSAAATPDSSSDLHREVVLWAIASGSAITVTAGDGRKVSLRKPADLPDGPFRVSELEVPSFASAADVERVHRLGPLDRLDLSAYQNRKASRAGSGADSVRAAEASWVSLSDLSQWEPYRGDRIGSRWESEAGGVLHLTGDRTGDIITKRDFGSFVLEFEWKVAPGGNSGVLYRVVKTDGPPYHTGPEYQVLDDDGHADGNVPEHRAGTIYGLFPRQGGRPRPAGEWNLAKVVVDGDRIEHHLNGERVVTATMGDAEWRLQVAGNRAKAGLASFAKAASGRIALQDLGSEVWYRNLRVKSLD